MRSRTLAILWLIALAAPAATAEHITQAELLHRVIDLERLTKPPAPGELSGCFSSLAPPIVAGMRVGGGSPAVPGAPAQYLRTDEAGWNVMAEIDGPGAVTRIWSPNPHGDIRFVLDDEVVIDTTFDELLSGRMAPFEKPLVRDGSSCYFPVGFARGCRIVCRDSTAHYQINVVRYPDGTSVERFTRDLDETTQAVLAEVKQALTDGLTPKQRDPEHRTRPISEQKDLGPGDTLRCALEGAGTVRSLAVALTNRVDPRAVDALHRCVLRVFVDGEHDARVEAPVSDFFGTGIRLVPFRGLPVGTHDPQRPPFPLPDRRHGQTRFMYSHFPMPYRDGLVFEIENLNADRRPIGLVFLLRVDHRPPNPDALRFHARFRQEDPCRSPQYPIVETTGRGRVVGCVLNVASPHPWWHAGDEAELGLGVRSFPAHFGARPGTPFVDAAGMPSFLRPLVGVTRADAFGRSSAYRWRLADAIGFQGGIRLVLDNPRHEAGDTCYSSVVYWYGEPGAKHFFEPLTVGDVTPPGLRIPGAIEVEGRVQGADWGHVVRQKHAGGAELSGGAAAHISTEEPVRIVLPSKTARTVRLKLRVNPRRSFETVSVTGSEKKLIGTVQYDRSADGIYVVGVMQLAKGDNTVTVQCSRAAMLDCWILEDLPAAGSPTD